MSTDLYGVRILALAPEERRVRFRVFVVYYDTHYKYYQPIPDDKSFFLRILRDHTFGALKSEGPLYDEISSDLYLNEDFVDSNAYRYIERFERLATRNEDIKDWSEYSDFYYERDGRWKDEKKLVQADYDVYVTDAKYLSHLVVGASWGSTSYPTRSDALTLEEAPKLPDLRLEHHRLSPFAGPQERGTPDRVAFSDDGRYLAVSSQAGEIVVYEVWSWKEKLRVDFGDLFPEIEFLPGRYVITARYFAQAKEGLAWDITSGKRIKATVPPGRARSRGGKYRVDYGHDHTLTFIGPDEGVYRTLKTEAKCVEAVAFTADDAIVATGGMGELIQLWNPASGALLKAIPFGERQRTMAFSPDGAYLGLTFGGHSAALMRVSDGQIVRRVDFKNPSYQRETDTYAGDIAYSPGGRLIAISQSMATDGYGGHVSLYERGARWPGFPADGVEERGPAAAGAKKTPKKAQKKKARGDGAGERKSGLNAALMRRLAEGKPPPSGEELKATLEAHARFILTGGAGGRWEILDASGLTLAIYVGAQAAEGKQADLHFANLSGVDLRGASLPFANLTAILGEGADFSGADLSGSAATDSSLAGARFRGANLAGADFSRSDLRGADLRDADLSGADFESCDLSGADFSGAEIGGIKLPGAKLDGARGFGY